MSDIISQVGKGKRQGIIEAIADTDIGQRVINSPLARSTGATLKGIASGVAVPTALAIDSVNTGVNAVNGALGGSSELLPKNTTKSVVNWGMGADGSKPQTIAGPVAPPASASVQASNNRSVVQRPPLAISTPAPTPAPTIAGGIQKSVGKFGETKFSDGSGGFAMNEQNRLANVAMQDKQAEQLANEKYIANANAIDPIFGMAAQASVARNNLGKYTSDQHLAGVKYNADAHTKAAEIAGGAAVAKAQQEAKVKQQEQGQKDYADRIKGLMGEWSKLNLPKEYVPKLNEFAKVYAAAEDPNSNTWLMPPNREGGMYAAMPRQYESVYAKLLQTMPHKDAAARVYQLAQQNGHVKDVPDFRRFLPTGEAIKNQNQTLIAGA